MRTELKSFYLFFPLLFIVFTEMINASFSNLCSLPNCRCRDGQIVCRDEVSLFSQNLNSPTAKYAIRGTHECDQAAVSYSRDNGFPIVKSIIIENCGIVGISSGFLSGCAGIEEIYLGNNSISSLDGLNAYDQEMIVSSKKLNISWNEIEIIPWWVLESSDGNSGYELYADFNAKLYALGGNESSSPSLSFSLLSITNTPSLHFLPERFLQNNRDYQLDNAAIPQIQVGDDLFCCSIGESNLYILNTYQPYERLNCRMSGKYSTEGLGVTPLSLLSLLGNVGCSCGEATTNTSVWCAKESYCSSANGGNAYYLTCMAHECFGGQCYYTSSTNTPSSTPGGSSGPSGLSQDVLITLIIVAIAGVVILCSLLWWCCWYRKKTKMESEGDNVYEGYDEMCSGELRDSSSNAMFPKIAHPPLSRSSDAIISSTADNDRDKSSMGSCAESVDANSFWDVEVCDGIVMGNIPNFSEKEGPTVPSR